MTVFMNCISLNTKAQKLGVSSGVVLADYYDFHKMFDFDDIHYTPHPGRYYEVKLRRFNVGDVKINFSLGYKELVTDIYESGDFMNQGYIEHNIYENKRDMLFFSIDPLVVYDENDDHFSFNLGFDSYILLNESYSQYYYSTPYQGHSQTIAYPNPNKHDINHNFETGLSLSFNYDFHLVPQVHVSVSADTYFSILKSSSALLIYDVYPRNFIITASLGVYYNFDYM
jgi:hypothetical protein